jgi:hypothetical protein
MTGDSAEWRRLIRDMIRSALAAVIGFPERALVISGAIEIEISSYFTIAPTTTRGSLAKLADGRVIDCTTSLQCA